MVPRHSLGWLLLWNESIAEGGHGGICDPEVEPRSCVPCRRLDRPADVRGALVTGVLARLSLLPALVFSWSGPVVCGWRSAIFASVPRMFNLRSVWIVSNQICRLRCFFAFTFTRNCFLQTHIRPVYKHFVESEGQKFEDPFPCDPADWWRLAPWQQELWKDKLFVHGFSAVQEIRRSLGQPAIPATPAILGLRDTHGVKVPPELAQFEANARPTGARGPHDAADFFAMARAAGHNYM